MNIPSMYILKEQFLKKSEIRIIVLYLPFERCSYINMSKYTTNLFDLTNTQQQFFEIEVH